MDDLISRQAAIDEVDEWIKAFRENGHKESAADACLIKDGVIQLPSAQPEIIRCKDCKHYLDGGCGNVDSQSPSKNLMGVKPDWYCADGERREE